MSLDEKRRKTQTALDQQLAEANRLAKEIGQLFKSGKRRSTSIERTVWRIEKQYQGPSRRVAGTAHKPMLEIRYQIPNVPRYVPAGTSEDDNQKLKKVENFLHYTKTPYPIGNWLKNTI